MVHRNKIYIEQAVILSQQAYDGDQYVMRLRAPETAGHAEPGSFVHLQCDPQLPMRRPLSIMRTDRDGRGFCCTRCLAKGHACFQKNKLVNHST